MNALRCLALLLAAAVTLGAAVNGRVVNRTTGQPQAGVPVTLIQMDQGMDPIAETFTGNDGSFSFDHDLTNAAGQRTFGMLRAEHMSINYSQPLPPMRGVEGVEIEIYDTVSSGLEPSGRIIVLEPGQEEVVVNESYLFNNAETPPATYRDPSGGSLQFYLPPEARGIVEVQGTGPAGMPLNSSAQPAGEPNLYQVDFPIKPGSNRIALTYVAARPADGELLSLPSRYPNVTTRLAAPQGIQLAADNLTSLGVEPNTQAEVFEVAQATEVAFSISGSGALPRREAPAAGEIGGGSPNQISVESAPIAEELPWILLIAAGILGIGFYNLHTSKA